MKAVFDANAYLGLSVPHDLNAAATRVAAAFEHPYAPEQIVPEAANALRRMVRMGEVPESVADEAVRMLPSAIALVSMSDMGNDALRLMRVLDHSAYDCTYLVLAERMRCPLISGDRKFLRKAERVATVPLLDLFDLPEAMP